MLVLQHTVFFHPFRVSSEWQVSKTNKNVQRRGSGCVRKLQ